jgi:hypothetical protein
MRSGILTIVCIGTVLLLHMTVRYNTTSLFLAASTIPILIATAMPVPFGVGIVILLFLELVSSFPQGSMALVFAIPFFTRSLMKGITVDASWKFFGYVSMTVALQVVSLVAIQAFIVGFSNTHIPLPPTLLQIIGTSMSTFVLALIVHELHTRP